MLLGAGCSSQKYAKTPKPLLIEGEVSWRQIMFPAETPGSLSRGFSSIIFSSSTQQCITIFPQPQSGLISCNYSAYVSLWCFVHFIFIRTEDEYDWGIYPILYVQLDFKSHNYLYSPAEWNHGSANSFFYFNSLTLHIKNINNVEGVVHRGKLRDKNLWFTLAHWGISASFWSLFYLMVCSYCSASLSRLSLVWFSTAAGW